MTYLDHIDDLDILQYPVIVQRNYEFDCVKQLLEETLVIHKLITNE